MTSENPLPITFEDEQAIQKLVSGYYNTFVVDPILAASHYGEPTLIVLPNQLVSLITRRDVEVFLTRGRDDLTSRGYLSTRMHASRIKRLNATTGLYGTVAIRMKTDGTELERVPLYTCYTKATAAGRFTNLSLPTSTARSRRR